MFVVVAYTKRYECRWQVIEVDGTVIRSYTNRKDALKALEELVDSKHQEG